MRIATLNYSDSQGGAARAALRIHEAVRSVDGASTFWVNHRVLNRPDIKGPEGTTTSLLAKAGPVVERMCRKVFRTDKAIVHSSGLMPTFWHRRLLGAADVVNLHWVNAGMMSIADIGRIKVPVVWTLHDMWAFCGAEHYPQDFRWRDGYSAASRPEHESGFDLNRWVWGRKLRQWRTPMHIVTPSRWLAECVRQSALMHEWDVQVIPNAIDTDFWRPIDRIEARRALNLPTESALLLFGAIRGGADPRKGFDLLCDALERLKGKVEGLELVVFGEERPSDASPFGFPVHYMGHVDDEETLRRLYCAADAMLIPSRQDNLPNTGVEAQCCGTPVIAFDVGGLPDIVVHEETGYLARAFDCEDLAHGIRWVVAQGLSSDLLRDRSRHRAASRYAYAAVGRQYLDAFSRAREAGGRSRG